MLPVLSQSEADLIACYVQDMTVLLDSFSEKDSGQKQSLQQMLASDRAAFRRAAIRVLAHSPGSAGARYVLHLLRKESLLMEALADSRESKREDAVGAARAIQQAGVPIDADLERTLGAALSLPPSAAHAARVLRLLDVLEAASPQPRFYLFQTELMAYPDSMVRSRSILLIATSSKSATLVARMLLDDDTRVQANAVEALWTFDPAEAHPLLVNAARSKTPRVAGNAAVGLYRTGDLSSLRVLFAMAREQDSSRRATAAWAMGETGDARFLPFLTSWFPRSSGEERVNILQALARLRRREKSCGEVGAVEIRAWDVRAQGASRQLVLSLWSHDRPDLSSLKATDFAFWEGDALVDDYEVAAHPNPALAISGFVLPRFSSISDPYALAVLEAIDRCLKYKRADDLWRVDRYLTDPRTEGGAPLEKAALPYEESLLGNFAKSHQRGFLAAPEALRKILENAGSRARAADDAIAAFDRQSDAMIKFSGKRKLFLFLSARGAGRLDRHMARLTSFVTGERIALHGIAPKGAAECEEYRGLCLASEGGSFAMLDPEEVPLEIERIYAQSINRFNVTYRVPQAGDATQGAVQVSSGQGCGRTVYPLL